MDVWGCGVEKTTFYIRTFNLHCQTAELELKSNNLQTNKQTNSKTNTQQTWNRWNHTQSFSLLELIVTQVYHNLLLWDIVWIPDGIWSPVLRNQSTNSHLWKWQKRSPDQPILTLGCGRVGFFKKQLKQWSLKVLRAKMVHHSKDMKYLCKTQTKQVRKTFYIRTFNLHCQTAELELKSNNLQTNSKTNTQQTWNRWNHTQSFSLLELIVTQVYHNLLLWDIVWIPDGIWSPILVYQGIHSPPYPIWKVRGFQQVKKEHSMLARSRESQHLMALVTVYAEHATEPSNQFWNVREKQSHVE